MFNFFNQKNKTNNEIIKNNETIDTIFPSAKETLKNTVDNWPTIDSQKILKEIIYKSNRGQRDALFCSAYISEQARLELIQQGYKVETLTFLDGTPYFRISW